LKKKIKYKKINNYFENNDIPPIVNKAEITNSIPIATYKSRSIDNFINNAPENKSALSL